MVFPPIAWEGRGVWNSRGTVSFPKQAAQARVKEVEKEEVEEENWRGEQEEEEDRLRRTGSKGSRNGGRGNFLVLGMQGDAPLLSKGLRFVIACEPYEHKQPQLGKYRL